jgi:Ca-activated chloride channel family protein
MNRTGIVLVAATVTTAVAVGTTVVYAAAGPPPCADRAVTVAAAPEIATAIADALAGADSAPPSDRCALPTVDVRDPAQTAAALRTGTAARPDVWIPDSTLWIDSAGLRSSAAPVGYPSIARSPVVLAVDTATAARLGWPQAPVRAAALLDPPGGAGTRLMLAEPRRSAPEIGALLAVQAATAGRPGATAALTAALRAAARPEAGSATGAPSGSSTGTAAGALSRLGTTPGIAVPTSEQAVWARNGANGRPDAVATYLTGPGTTLDYPFVSLAADPQRQARIARVFTALQTEPARRVFGAHGFRDAQGNLGAASIIGPELNAAATAVADPPTADAVSAAVRRFELVNAPSRTLAVLDVSGSMNLRVPGAGGATRLELARQAAAQGLALFSDDSQVGLWVFATDLTATTDYRELVPAQLLAKTATGASGRDQLEQAIRQVAVSPAGDTGLYDTTLAAVRAARASWDPERVNTVLMLTDGHNDDRDGITLAQLLTALRQSDEPGRPVPVLTIAYGPDSDERALAAISAATGGATYRAADPRQVGAVFLEAINQRVCRPNC